MKKNILLLIIISFYSCYKTEDDTNNKCFSNCTILQGQFITLDNVGIAGVKVSLKYKNSSDPLGLSSRTRLIAEAETDENGNFYKEFYIKDSELGESAEGYFEINYDDTNLDVTKYILSDNLIGWTAHQPLKQAVYSINTRDTIIGNTCYLPKKTYIKINLNNFVPLQNGDVFKVQTFYPFGPNVGYNNFLQSEYATGFSGYDAFEATEINNQFNVFVAEGENNIIRIIKIKDGISTPKSYTIFIPKNNNIELTYEY